MITLGLTKDELKSIAERDWPPEILFSPAQTEEEWNQKGRALVDWAIETMVTLIDTNNDEIERNFDDRVRQFRPRF